MVVGEMGSDRMMRREGDGTVWVGMGLETGSDRVAKRYGWMGGSASVSLYVCLLRFIRTDSCMYADTYADVRYVCVLCVRMAGGLDVCVFQCMLVWTCCLSVCAYVRLCGCVDVRMCVSACMCVDVLMASSACFVLNKVFVFNVIHK